MAVKLRLVRMGKKKQPTYRVVAADSRSPRDGRFLEVVGNYAPRGRSKADDAAIITIDHDKAIKWLKDGATPTDTVERLLRTAGTLDRMAGGDTAKSAPAAEAPAAEAEAPAAETAESSPAETAQTAETATDAGDGE